MDLVYAVYRNGGMAYVLALLLTYFGVGYPMIMLETLVGQYSGRKTMKMYRLLCPLFHGE